MKKNTALLLLSLPLVAGLLAALWFFGPPLYRQKKVARFQRQAVQALAARDYRSAWLSAQQTVRLNPTNLVAYRILVDIAGRVQSPAELDLRRRLAELEPTLDNHLLVAATSLRSQRPPYPVAAQVIEDFATTASNAPAYHVLAAQLALKLKQMDTAAGHFQQAAALEPTNRLHELNLAVLRLGSSNGLAVASARKTLEVLADDPAHGTLALSWLVNDSLRRRDLASATVCSELLLAHPKATPADRLQHLDILWETPGQPFTNFLTSLQHQAVTNAGQVFQVSAWLANHGLAGASLRWLKSLPEELRTQQPIPVAIADCLLATEDWAGAERFLTVGGPTWGESDYLRLAFLSEAARHLNQATAADGRWREAVRAADQRLGALTDLSSLARDWKLGRERADLLWQIVESFPRQRWALRELEVIYQQAKDLRGLSRVYQRLLAYQPQDILLRNNLAAANLLLNQGVPEASEAAKVLYDATPENPILASTYAFALHKLGRTRDGLAMLAKLKPASLHSPGVAVYYAVLLDASGEKNAALPYAADARRGNLLPEELQLLTAVDGLRSGDPVPKP